MGGKHSRPQPQGDATDARDNQQQPQGDELSAEARAEFTVADIHSPENTRRAQQLRGGDLDRFCKYRNYFKNHHMSLAREVGRKTSKSKAELLRWVEGAVGPLEGGAQCTKDEILEIAMVSAALSEYGEAALAQMYDRGELDALPNVPLHTHNLRMPAKQQACRDNSDAANKDKLEAAHYIGLEVMLRLNERLPVEQRMGEELREILNHPSNLRLMLATSNQVLHKKVDAMLINAKDAAEQKETSNRQSRKISAREYDRLVQIAKHAQDEGFQDAMIAANG
ncbi:Kinetochore protein mis18 [Phytophthora cinnamomi]|nr:Kinetochore protein mis18 [Phytophthora cinnamomi]